MMIFFSIMGILLLTLVIVFLKLESDKHLKIYSARKIFPFLLIFALILTSILFSLHKGKIFTPIWGFRLIFWGGLIFYLFIAIIKNMIFIKNVAEDVVYDSLFEILQKNKISYHKQEKGIKLLNLKGEIKVGYSKTSRSAVVVFTKFESKELKRRIMGDFKNVLKTKKPAPPQKRYRISLIIYLTMVILYLILLGFYMLIKIKYR